MKRRRPDRSDPSRGDPTRGDPWWLVKYVMLAAAEGVAAGWTFLLILLHLDTGGLGTLVHGAASGPLALVILALSFGVRLRRHRLAGDGAVAGGMTLRGVA